MTQAQAPFSEAERDLTDDPRVSNQWVHFVEPRRQRKLQASAGSLCRKILGTRIPGTPVPPRRGQGEFAKFDLIPWLGSVPKSCALWLGRKKGGGEYCYSLMLYGSQWHTALRMSWCLGQPRTRRVWLDGWRGPKDTTTQPRVDD